MRVILVAVLVSGLLVQCRAARAQSWRTDPSTSPTGTYAGIDTAVARARYDEQQQSVFILDDRPAKPAWPAAASPPIVARAYPTGTVVPAAFSSPSVYESAQQFQLCDARLLRPGGSSIVYNTIEAPALPPGAIVPECIDYSCEPYSWQILPQGLIWHSYLAGPKEPRFEAVVFSGPHLHTEFDGMLGGRVGLLRYGNTADFRPQGWQLDLEGAAIIRQDITEDEDVDGYDFRIGIPVTYGWGRYMMKIAWYHTSAHLGDEFMLKHPLFPRINYSRNAIVWGHAFYLTDAIRIYGEIDYGYSVDGGNEPWAFQFGWEYSPVIRGPRGVPFLAMNAFLREENDFGGFYDFQTGWQWRGARGGQLVRIGFHYQTGPSTLNEFFRQSEQQIGAGLWYDF